MACSCKRFWILSITLFVLRDASGYGVWNKGSLADQRSISVSAPQLPGLPSQVSGQTGSTYSVTPQSSQGPGQSQPVLLSSPMVTSVVPASGSVGGYSSAFQSERFSGPAAQPQLAGSSSRFVTQLQQQGVSGAPQQGALQQSPSGSLQSVASVQGFPSQQASAPQQQGSSWNQAGQSSYVSSGSPQPQLVGSSSRLVTQLQQQGVSGPPQQGALQQSPSGSFQSVASVQGFPSQQASTPQQQGSFWNQAGQSSDVSSGSPQPSSVVPLPSQPQRSPEQVVYGFQAGSLSQPQSVGGGLSPTSPQGSSVGYSSPSGQQGVSQSRPGSLPQLKARLFTSQGASVTSSSPRPASDFAPQTGSPYLSVPSQGAATWQASSSVQPGVQAAPSQVQSATSDQYGAPVARFDQYAPASQTSGSYGWSQGFSSRYGGVPSQSGVVQTASVSQPQQSPVVQQSSGSPSTPVLSSLYNGFPRLGSTGDSFSGGLSGLSYKPISQRVSARYDPSVKH